MFIITVQGERFTVTDDKYAEIQERHLARTGSLPDENSVRYVPDEHVPARVIKSEYHKALEATKESKDHHHWIPGGRKVSKAEKQEAARKSDRLRRLAARVAMHRETKTEREIENRRRREKRIEQAWRRKWEEWYEAEFGYDHYHHHYEPDYVMLPVAYLGVPFKCSGQTRITYPVPEKKKKKKKKAEPKKFKGKKQLPAPKPRTAKQQLKDFLNSTEFFTQIGRFL